jgi:eukaryotic-like serine/threonine-protein kinase
MILEPGYRLLDRYEINKALGMGSFGTVYLAFDHHMKKSVAIKELKSEWLIDPTVRQHFIAEATAMGSLEENSNIVTVHELLTPDKDHLKSYYIIMQFIKGGSIEDLIQRNHTLPVKTSLEIIIGVCRALETAHKAGIIHRDIKPSNILLGASGEGKLTDFGVAHIPELGSDGKQTGTLIWFSPEQARGQRLDCRTDLFSLSAVLYSMLTGRYYLDFETCFAKARESANHIINEREKALYVSQQVCNLIAGTRPTRPSFYRAEISQQLDLYILKGMAEKPDERFQTALEMANALSAVLKAISDEPVALDLDKARVLLKEHQFDEAARITQKILRKDDDNSSAHELMGDIHLRRGEYSSAELQWEKAVKLKSASMGIYSKLGTLHNKLGHFREGVEAFKKGLEVIPNDDSLLYGLAAAQWGLGDHQTAISTLTASNEQHHDKRKEALLAGWRQESQLNTNNGEDRTLHD